MQVQTFRHHPAQGWSVPALPAWDSSQTLVLAFGSPGLTADSESLRGLAETYPRSLRLGCSTAGEIHDAAIYDDSLAVAVVKFDGTRLAAAVATVTGSDDSAAAGADLARQLAGPELRCVFVLSDGLMVNGSELVEGLIANLPAEVVVTGGLAGDGDRFGRTWVLQGDRMGAGLVAAVGLYGDRLRVGHGSNGGWDLFGPERTITRSVKNVLYELDGKPALELYKQYLGERAAGLPATGLLYPLQVDLQDGRTVVRTILAVSEEDQSLTFAGDVPAGRRAQLMKANFDRLVQGAEQAALSTGSQEATGEGLAIAISCVGRRLVLGERTEEEVEAVRDAMPAGTHQIGFYSYGEISPGAMGRCDLHNQTMTLTSLSEV